MGMSLLSLTSEMIEKNDSRLKPGLSLKKWTVV